MRGGEAEGVGQSPPGVPAPECFKCVLCKEVRGEEGSLVLPCLHHLCGQACLDKLAQAGKSIKAQGPFQTLPDTETALFLGCRGG